MTARAIKQLAAFDFRSDFTVPLPATPDTVTLDAAELASLLRDAQDAGARAVQSEILKGQTEEVSEISRQLSAALAELTGLARHLECLDISTSQIASVRHRIEAVCQRMLDGQGDLFDADGR